MAQIDNENTVKTKEQSTATKIKRLLFDHSVPVLFIIICLIGVYFSELPAVFIVNTLLTRITRNSFMVLALVLPVIAGLGLNFGLVIGAMAGQFGILIVTHFKIGGFPGFLLCLLLSTPFAVIFGLLTARLLNRTKGQEMISSMIAGFFANGVYQFILLFLVGTLIPIKNPDLVLTRGIGIKNTIDLTTEYGLKYSVDGVFKYPLFYILAGVGVLAGLVVIIDYIIKSKKAPEQIDKFKYITRMVISGVILGVSLWVIKSGSMLNSVKLPVATAVMITILWVCNVLVMKTKLGQDFRTVGHNMDIAKVSGVNVDKTRTIAMVISTVLAAWGQVIFLQNIGTMSTYGSHVQIATFAIASILLGGASVTKATSGQAILGVILFHTLFIVSPKAGNNLFGDAQIGEFFRAFVSYGVIGVALGLHAWNKRVQALRRQLDV
ncbi:MAG: ABC transporter permease [Bacillota bacterium]|nr:ABC transporter permease [Bacillota bacterium]MDD3297741.1 ABC transporter permease [Bacillota bacterium]MDD3850077.1 ABC transporter permease [Bacillota bacterium]MDD4706686.1 ABC transporter permease [Bacillota bacterium]